MTYSEKGESHLNTLSNLFTLGIYFLMFVLVATMIYGFVLAKYYKKPDKQSS